MHRSFHLALLTLALVIRLHTSFNAQMRDLTKAHVGQTGTATSREVPQRQA